MAQAKTKTKTQDASARQGTAGKARRTSYVNIRVTPAQHADWQSKAASAGLSLSELIRRAMARTRRWTVPEAALERERTLQLARIGANLNQLARWANTEKGALDATVVISHLQAIEQELAALRPALRQGDAG